VVVGAAGSVLGADFNIGRWIIFFLMQAFFTLCARNMQGQQLWANPRFLANIMVFLAERH